MLVGIIKDLINNVNYYTYVNVYQAKLNYRVKCIDDEKCYYLKNEEIHNLFSKIFNYNKKYFEKTNDFDIFVDDDNNKHYFKNGYENIEMFFNNNGTIALMNVKKKDKKEKNDYPKLFKVSNIKEDISLILICSLIGLNALYLGMNIESRDLSFDSITDSITSTYHYYNNIDVNEITDKINTSTGLEVEDKNYLINEELFNDVLSVATRKRNQELREKLTNVTNIYFTEEELKDEKKKTCAGYYNYLEPNLLHLRDELQKRGVKSHEFVHLLQDNNQYYFIREAVAELITEEYYGEKTNTYLEEIKYVKILMEIIGPKPVFECCFKGDTLSFENKIKEFLNEEDAKTLLDLFSVAPAYHANMDEVYYKIYNLLNKMKNRNLEEDFIIKTIIEHPEYVKRGYFNKKYIEKCSEQLSIVFEEIRVEEAVKENVIEVECSLVKLDKLSLEEFLLSGGDTRNISYSSIEDYTYRDKYVINIETKEKYSLKEAIEKGYIYDVEFFKSTVIPNVTLEDAIKYENTNDYKGHIRIKNVNSDKIRHFNIPRFVYKGKEGSVPIVGVYIEKNIEPISEKFPEQFNEIKHKNKF